MLDAFLEPDKYPRVTTKIETLRGGPESGRGGSKCLSDAVQETIYNLFELYSKDGGVVSISTCLKVHGEK